jgi:hypothetical protein
MRASCSMIPRCALRIWASSFVIPEEAGNQSIQVTALDPRFRGDERSLILVLQPQAGRADGIAGAAGEAEVVAVPADGCR